MTGDLIMACPECGVDVTAWAQDVDLIEVYDAEPLWEGGPVVQTGFYPVALRPVNRRMTFQPCGHVLPTEGLVITSRPRPTASPG